MLHRIHVFGLWMNIHKFMICRTGGPSTDSLTPDTKLILDELTRYLNMEKLIPSYRLVITVSCLKAIRHMQKFGHLPPDCSIFKSYAVPGNFTDVRLAALEALVDFMQGRQLYLIFLFYFISFFIFLIKYRWIYFKGCCWSEFFAGTFNCFHHFEKLSFSREELRSLGISSWTCRGWQRPVRQVRHLEKFLQFNPCDFCPANYYVKVLFYDLFLT